MQINDYDMIEVIPERFYLISSNSIPRTTEQSFFFNIDQEMKYQKFNDDFGPLNIQQIFLYVDQVNQILRNPGYSQKSIYHHTSLDPHNQVLSWQVKKIFSLEMTPKNVLKKFNSFGNKLVGYRDACQGPSLFQLTINHCLRAMYHCKFFGLQDQFNFDYFTYDYFNQLENGYLNWMLKDKILAFSSPISQDTNNSQLLEPEAYVPLFKEWNVKLVIRLNKPTYDSKKFSKEGIQHVDLYFPDGTIPNEKIIKRFINLVEQCDGAVAVHCRAGLGRTGTLIALYMMKHYGFGAPEIIAYLRFLRPGSVLGIQQNFLISQQFKYRQLFMESPLFKNMSVDQKKQLCKFFSEQIVVSQSYGKLKKLLQRSQRDDQQGVGLINQKASKINQFFSFNKKLSIKKLDYGLVQRLILKCFREGFCFSYRNFFFKRKFPYGELSLSSITFSYCKFLIVDEEP